MAAKLRRVVTTKTTGRLREVLASNVHARMLARYRGTSDNARINQLRKEAGGLGRRTLQRILNPEADDNDLSLGTIEDIAMALRCEVYELLKEPDPE